MKTEKVRVIKAFLLAYIPLVLGTVLLSWLVYHVHFVKTRQGILFSNEINLVKLQKTFVGHLIKSVVADINIITEELDIENYDITTQADATHVIKNFLTFSRYKGIYDQIRVIDASGHERIRVDFRGETPISVPKTKLQFKGHRYYFADTMKLEKKGIYMSPFDLNQENGKIERPFKPMIRFGKVLWSRDGEKQGILILNYLGQNLIHELETISYQSPGHLMLANSEGYWLKSINPDDEWGFLIPKRRNKTIQNDYPDLWKKIQGQDSGQTITSKGLFTFEKIYLLDDTIRSSGTGTASDTSRSMLTNKDRYWLIFSHVQPEIITRGRIDFLKLMVEINLVFLTLLAVLTWKMIQATHRRKAAETALKKSHQNLEKKVTDRTCDLQAINKALTKEIQEHKKTVQNTLKMEAQLRQAQKMEAIGTLAGGIAHDFNNLLTPILGFSEMIKAEIKQPHPMAGDINEIIKAATRAKELVQQILAISRHTERELRPLRVELVVKEALKLLRSTIPTTISIKTKIPADCSRVIADPIDIHQITMNLCTNAYHAMRQNGGVLTVTLTEVCIRETDAPEFNLPPGKYILLTVCDTGPGIPKDCQDKIFEPYFTTKQQGDGTGLGLAVIHSIVQSLKGGIYVESEPDQGACFSVYLPAVQSQGVQGQRLKEHHAYVTGTERILLVDDDISVLKIETRILSGLGYQVTARGGSREALETFASAPDRFDLIITDMTMPDMTGMDLVGNILKLSPGMKSILCTGYSDTKTVEEIRQMGINAILTKPVTLASFARTVRRVMDGD